MIVTGIRQLTPRIRAYELRSYSGGDLPVINAGAHLEIPVLLAGNKFEKRHYSICSNPNRRDIYEIAVLQEIDGMGGSVAIHEQVALGQNLKCSMPQNHFELPHDDNPVILIAGGIGITAIKSMAQELQSKGKKFTIHYAGRSRKEMAFVDRLQREYTDKLSIYPKDENKRLDLTNIINSAANNATFYLCGPEKLLTDFKQLAQQNGIATNRIHFERFNKVHNKDDQPIKVTLAKSNKTLTVTSEQSILEAMIEADINIPYSCQTGSCTATGVTLSLSLSLVPQYRQSTHCHADHAVGDTDVFYWEKFTTKPYVDTGELKRIGEFPTPWPSFMVAASDSILAKHPKIVVKILNIIHNKCSSFMKNSETVIPQVAERYQLKVKDAENWFHRTEWAIDGWVSDKMLQSVVFNLKLANLLEQNKSIPELIWKR